MWLISGALNKVGYIYIYILYDYDSNITLSEAMKNMGYEKVVIDFKKL